MSYAPLDYYPRVRADDGKAATSSDPPYVQRNVLFLSILVPAGKPRLLACGSICASHLAISANMGYLDPPCVSFRRMLSTPVKPAA